MKYFTFLKQEKLLFNFENKLIFKTVFSRSMLTLFFVIDFSI